MEQSVFERAYDIQDLPLDDLPGAMRDGDERTYTALATFFLRLRDELGKLEAKKKDLNKSLMEYIDRYGYEDGKGGKVLDLAQTVLGYNKLHRQRRASKRMDEEAAERLLRSRGLWDRCTKLVPSLDEDEIMACLYEGVLSEEDIDTMFPVKETFALVPKK